MPEINGFEMADMMREHPRFQKTAILFISAVRMSDLDRIRGYQSGAVDYISVPVVPEVLRAKVSVFVDLHRKTRELEELNRELEDRVQQRTRELQESESQVRQLNSQLELRIAELETIMQVLPVGIAVARDQACNSVTVNHALRDLLGMPAHNESNEGAEGEKPQDHYPFVGQSDATSADFPIRRAIATGAPVAATEWDMPRPDGSSVPVLGSASPLFGADGQVRGAVGAFVDVSDRKKMENLLRERADLLELASEAILVRDMSGVVQYWNAGAEALYGWSREQIVGRPVNQILETETPIDPTRVESALMSHGRWDGNLIQQTCEGQEVIVASRQVFKKDTGSILEINRDITAQTRAEEALRRTEKLAAMGRVAGIIAHEINNPLEAITNAFYLLRDHPSLDEEARYYAQLGDGELARVCHITKQTLGFYRESQHPVDLSIAALLDDVLQLQGRQLLVGRIKLEKRYFTDGNIRGFPVELRQVFFNLIGNAVQAMPEGGTLRLRIGERWNEMTGRNDICITCSDTGAGVSPEHSKHLFEPFFTTKSSKGTGLGLWISKGIIQKYDGAIHFRSMAFNGGNVTVFCVVLPGSGPSFKTLANANHLVADETARGVRDRA
jgi:PAS domain S-box-containing protein